MIVTWQVALRIALLVLLGVVLQLSFFSEIELLGSTPDVLPVLAVALGLLGGGVVGAVCGFALGLLTDSLLLQTLGVSSIVLLTVGYLAGRWRESFDITSSFVPPLLTGALALFGAAMFAAIQLMLGVESPVSLLVVREILVKGLLAALLAIPLYPLVRFVLRPALVDDARGGRGRRGRRGRRRSLTPIRAA
ncbi:MAG TPA: rod shape-determining protein MreD [Solirubrobacterales bacterium]